jgi:nickel-dependent lactate racemase
MTLFSKQSLTGFLSGDDLREVLIAALDDFGSIKNMLIVPPDITRLHSLAGMLTRFAYEYNPAAVKTILPALGTHFPMTEAEIETMFGNLPKSLFKEHRWRSDCRLLGEIPAAFVRQVSEGIVDYSVPVEINKTLFEPGIDCILSIGQVVPHEVAGMASHNKNIFVGLGGAGNIHKSHFLGAAYGMERIMGRAESPVRALFDYAIATFCGSLPIVHALTVMDRDERGALRPRGFFAGTGKECFNRAAELSRKVNIQLLDHPLKKVVVYLDPAEYKSFWLGNKAIYRTRMAIANKGELIVLAPGIKSCGEDPSIDTLIRQFGYHGTPAVMEYIKCSKLLEKNLSAAAHLIHGSSEGRFSVTYCAGGLCREDVEKAGFAHTPVNEMLERYNPDKLQQGINRLPDGEEIYFIPNPGMGLWALKKHFET